MQLLLGLSFDSLDARQHSSAFTPTTIDQHGGAGACRTRQWNRISQDGVSCRMTAAESVADPS